MYCWPWLSTSSSSSSSSFSGDIEIEEGMMESSYHFYSVFNRTLYIQGSSIKWAIDLWLCTSKYVRNELLPATKWVTNKLFEACLQFPWSHVKLYAYTVVLFVNKPISVLQRVRRHNAYPTKERTIMFYINHTIFFISISHLPLLVSLLCLLSCQLCIWSKLQTMYTCTGMLKEWLNVGINFDNVSMWLQIESKKWACEKHLIY